MTDLGKDDAREEIGRDTPEEGQILDCELGQVDVIDRAQHDLGLGPLRVVAERLSEVARRDQDGVDGAHAVIVVLLRGQLLRREL
jgi:hypothetical protein